MKFAALALKCIHIILVCLVWGLTAYSVPNVFFAKSTPVFREETINDGSHKTTALLYPGDCIRQSFQLDADYLESVSLAFAYEDSAIDSGELIIEFYHGTDSIVEQPLILAACPQNTFLSFHLGLENCGQNSLTVQIINVSEETAGAFSLLSTANLYAYGNYSEGYLLNGSKTEEGSILCSFNIRTGYNYYIGLTCVFFLLLGAIACTKLISAGYTWLRQHKCR